MEGLDEYAACVRLQEDTWGSDFAERVPASMLKVVQRLSGVVAGAFAADGALEGFVFGITGLEEGTPVHWSDMLAVRSGGRNAGLGRRLKLFQRRLCLERGITRMYWTFDPLESRNAWLNMGRLGAVAREYVPDMYGISASPLHSGIGTDRLVALWALDSERVRDRLSGRGAPSGLQAVDELPRAFETEVREGLPIPGPPVPELDGGLRGLLLPIPADIQAVKDAEPDLAVSWRRVTREVLSAKVGRGWEVRELIRGGPHLSYYLLQPMPRHPGPLS